MSEFEKALDWLESHTEEASEGINRLLKKIQTDIQETPNRIAMLRLLHQGGRKHLAELVEELSLGRKLVAYHEKRLERYGMVSSKLDKAPEGYPAVYVRYVELTPLGERMMRHLDKEVDECIEKN